MASCLTFRAVPVKFHNCNDSVTWVVGNYGFILVESTQIRWFLKWSGREGWSGRAITQRRPRVSKLGLKGLSDYHSNETAVEAARRGANGPNKRATLTTCFTQKRELENKRAEKGQKAARQMKSTMTEKKEFLTLTPGDDADGIRWRWWRWWWWRWWWVRTSWANHKSMWQRFGVLRVTRQKVDLNRRPIAYTAWEGGLGSHPTNT